MTSRALPLRSAPQNFHKKVNRLFAAAFGPSPAMYKHASLCGWWPLTAHPSPTSLLTTDSREVGSTWPDDNPPGVSVYETKDAIVIEVELPEIKENSLYLEISGDLLIIRGERSPGRSVRRHDLDQHHEGTLVQRFIHLPVIARPQEVRARLVGNIIKINISKHH